MAFNLHWLANPGRFLRFADRVQPWAAGATALAFVIGLYLALIGSPPDYQMREAVRIMYVHVPAAWMSLFVYANLALASAVALVWRHPLADIAARAAAPIGAAFTFLCLVTGGIWGQPMWGTWWVWDARLTSVLILFFFYLGHLALLNAFDDAERGARAAAILALVGVVNLPIIKFSVDWWSSLHQPASITRIGTPAIDPSMRPALLVMALAYLGFFITVQFIRMRIELARARVRALQFGDRAAEAT